MGFSKTSSVNYDADQDSSDLQTSQISTQPSVPSSTLIHPSSKPVSTSTKPVSTLQSTCVNIDIIPGQNYVSIPYSLSDMSVSSLFPKMKVYNYDNGWKVKTGNVNVGEPLMVISTSAHELSFCGQPQEVCYDLKQGWNVIGAPYEKMTTQQFETEYGITSVYSYENQKYVLENEIVPGHVYWIEIKDVSTSPTSICFGVMESAECDITTCTNITTSGYHALCTDIDATDYMGTHDACIDIQANDVELDGNGYSITGAGEGKGILVNGFDNSNIHD